MRIAIDIRPLRDIMTGIGRYISMMLGALSARDSKNEYLLFYPNLRGLPPAGVPGNDRFKIVSPRVPSKVITAAWAYSAFPKAETLLGKIDLFHAPSFQVPPVRGCVRIFTIYDLIPIIHPEMAIPAAMRHYIPRLRNYVERADLIVAISKATARDLTEYLGVPEQKITVVYPGATVIKKATDENISATKVKFNFAGDYILYVSRIDPRKNLPRLMKAFEMSGLHKDFQLVLAGPSGWHKEQFHDALNALKCRDRVKWLQYVPEADLSCLYSGATMLAYPSILEGFGLPILEAMSVRCPVLTSNVSSMPEVAGDAAMYVDPHDIDSIAEGMKRLAGDSNLRKACAERGQKRVELFTWEHAAEEMIKIYEHARKIKKPRP